MQPPDLREAADFILGKLRTRRCLVSGRRSRAERPADSSARPRPAEALLGDPGPAGEEPAPAYGRLQQIWAAHERVDGRACVLSFEEEDDLALANEDVVTFESKVLDLERRSLFDQVARRFSCAPFDRNDDRNKRPRHVLGPESSEELVQLSDQARRPTQNAQGGNEHGFAGRSLEDERSIAVDPLTLSPADLDGREFVEPNSQLFRIGGAV